MTDETVLAVFDTAAHAEAAVAELRSAGVPDQAIGLHAANASAAAGARVREQGFWSGLFGGEPDHDTAVYDRSLQAGSTVVTVKLPEAHMARVVQILESHRPVDIDERAAGYGLAPAPDARRDTAGETLRLAEEQLSVGKRVVNRGGTRIRRFVVETPVEQAVSLHSETVTLDRRPVTDGRPVTDSFSERTIELTGTAEEAVVSKTARVYEEVGLRKEATERVETVRDTVRKEEVAVEQVPGGTGTTQPRR